MHWGVLSSIDIGNDNAWPIAIEGWTMPRHSTVRLWKIMAKISQRTTRDNLKDFQLSLLFPPSTGNQDDEGDESTYPACHARASGPSAPDLPSSPACQGWRHSVLECGNSFSFKSFGRICLEFRRYHAAEFSSSSASSTEVAQICRALCTCHSWCQE